MKPLASEEVLFPLKEAADLCGDIKGQYLRDAVKRGLLTPVKRGARGRGHSHYFSVGQILGIQWVVSKSWGLVRDRWQLAEMVKVIREHESWPWTAVENFLGLKRDAWSDEVLAKVLQPQPRTQEEQEILDIILERPMPEEDWNRCLWLAKQRLRLRDAILIKLGRNPRITEPGGPARRK
jgi:hypothetical protein